MTEAVLELNNITRSFVQGEQKIDVLKGISLVLGRGETVALLGASGAGKSTLLQAAGLLEGGFGGDIRIDGQSCVNLSADERTALRAKKLGFVYQFHHLLPDFSALENVMMPQLIAGTKRTEASLRAESLLIDLGLGHRVNHRPAQLSGGEQQRVAVARALANEPKLILADEPTGNLDEASGRAVLQEFLRLVKMRGAAALIATHNRDLAASMDRVIMLRDGVVSGEATGAGARLL
jgi:lipoprotein-releasing system ATP-binding protein